MSRELMTQLKMAQLKSQYYRARKSELLTDEEVQSSHRSIRVKKAE